MAQEILTVVDAIDIKPYIHKYIQRVDRVRVGAVKMVMLTNKHIANVARPARCLQEDPDDPVATSLSETKSSITKYGIVKSAWRKTTRNLRTDNIPNFFKILYSVICPQMKAACRSVSSFAFFMVAAS